MSSTKRNELVKKHHHENDGEKCKITDHETICLDDKNEEGCCFTVDECVDLPNGHGCEWKQSFDQKSIHVHQKPVNLIVKEGCFKKKADHITVNANLKDCHVKPGKVTVKVHKPKVHVERQRVNVTLVKAKNHCEKPKVHVKWNCPKIHVAKPDVDVIIEKSCPVTAPCPVICVKREEDCHRRRDH